MTDMASRRRAAVERLEQAAAALAKARGLSWQAPRRKWDLEARRIETCEAVADLLERAVSGAHDLT